MNFEEPNDPRSSKIGNNQILTELVTVNQQSWEGPPSVWRHGQMARFEKAVKILVDKKKKSGWIFIIIGWLCTHCQHTFQFKQLVKVHVALYDPFKVEKKLSFFMKTSQDLYPYSELQMTPNSWRSKLQFQCSFKVEIDRYGFFYSRCRCLEVRFSWWPICAAKCFGRFLGPISWSFPLSFAY